ncbi:hypothetical protein AAZX31_20G217800 [Glycine max]|nr:hypothetical protein GLYMA_20G231700v4 [Glycine max]KAG4395500.1 hypothetical protein GLYMA_20G231700v4 [Glycine max]KAG4395501.1 hypothetical protein GLYMA_20G231700v4 [Glycine max]KAH1037584.1 hypothetical protein GYH30_056771 [Glycine max]KAH1037585.1 hypothetical protein GYH30_056771 [Glycine max]
MGLPFESHQSLRISWNLRISMLDSLFMGTRQRQTFSARFASSDGSEILSVVTRPANQLKITFLQAQNITDLGSLKEAAKIFVPGGSKIYSARSIKIKEDEGFTTYYFYEFGRDNQHVALMTGISSGKVCYYKHFNDITNPSTYT